ncbi:NACHT domain-containing protein [Rhizobium ruizarguesonis]|nr:NACHT domain-containing protein [Rhizobium ruizarguesonis]TBB49776.1 NACHT domain-containing protein [Rhizobium ruizarguesonis]
MARQQKPTVTQSKIEAVRSENPFWLTADPSGDGPPKPSAARRPALPLLDLGWENFERLCYRLAKCDGTVEKAWAYGTSGHEQLGIDVLVRLKDGGYEAWQSKRHKKFGLAAVRQAISMFEQAEWAKHASRFVLAVACEVSDPKVVNELESARNRLRAKNIAFEPLFAPELTEKLIEQPEIVDDFFGRPWVEEVCPPEALVRLTDRFSGRDMSTLRTRLRNFYAAWIGIVDPGLPLVGQAAADLPAPALAHRYVLPDVLLGGGNLEHDTTPIDLDDHGPQVVSAPTELAQDGQQGRRAVISKPNVRRVPINRFLADSERALIVADAGTGKTTLLRYLALDILSDEPSMEAVARKFVGYAPIWVPFALWARMSEGKDRPPGLEEVVHAFLDALSEPELAEAMRKVLRTGRFVLLVDGLDETGDQATADMLIVSLSSFVERSGAAAFATSRPHGLKALASIGGNWSRARLAPLTKLQGDELALLWYRILEAHELGAQASNQAIEQQARARASSFGRALTATAGISRLAQTPLFFLSLLKLYRLGRDLPRNRFDASREIIEQLVDHQPKRRAKDAMRGGAQQKMRQRERVLEDFAFAVHAGELLGGVSDGASDVAAISRATQVIMHRTGSTNVDLAEEDARAIFVFSEETAGLLVRKTQKDVGFLHRSLQEYFAGAQLVQLPFDKRVSFIKDHAGQTIWKEPILYLLYLTSNEQEVGHLVESIALAMTDDVSEDAVRRDLLTEAVFADFAHDIPKVQALAHQLFEEAELYAPDARQGTIASAAVNGLFSQSVSALCSAKLREWLPDYQGWSRMLAISAIRSWQPRIKKESVSTLVRILMSDHAYLSRTAGSVLAEIVNGDPKVKQLLLHLLRRPRSVNSLHAAMFTLGQGWGSDDDIGEIALRMRDYSDTDIKIDAIRIRCANDVADLEDLEIWSKLALDGNQLIAEGTLAPDIADYFARNHHPELMKRLVDILEKRQYTGLKTPILHGFLIADPSHPLAISTLKEALSEDYGIGQIFTRSDLPLNRVVWTPDLVAIIEKFVAKSERVAEHDWYNISRVIKLPSLKARMLASLRDGGHFTFWCSRALREFWPEDPEVKAAFYKMLDAPPEQFARVAADVAFFVDDQQVVRDKVIGVLRAKPRETRYLIGALRFINVAESDDEAFSASFEAGNPDGRYLDDLHWREAILKAFPERAEVRLLALAGLHDRDGNLGAISQAYSDDAEMCGNILKVLAPLPNPARLVLVEELAAASPSSEAAFELLAEARQDNSGSVAAEAVLGWTDIHLLQGTLGKAQVQFLINELDAVGMQNQTRRAAAVVGLITAGKLSAFADHVDHRGEPYQLEIVPFDLDGRQYLFLKRILAKWEEVADGLGGEAVALSRLKISAETALSGLDPGTAGAARLLDLLDNEDRLGGTRLRDRLAAWQRFDPHGPEMRRLIASMIIPTKEGLVGRTDREARLMAAGLFAEYFAETDLRNDVIAAFDKDPANDGAASALAEMIVRKRNSEVEDLLWRKARNVHYDPVTSLRLSAALGDVAKALCWYLADDPDRYSGWEYPYWVPTFIRRLNQDDDAVDAIVKLLPNAPSESARLSALLLVGLGGKDKGKTRPVLEDALRRYDAEPTPAIAFDVMQGTYRIASHAVRELLT